MNDKLVIDVRYPDDFSKEEIELVRREIKRKMEIFSRMVVTIREARRSEMSHGIRVADPQDHPNILKERF